MPADVSAGSGTPSGLGYAKQTLAGTYVAPTDVIDTTAFDFDDDPQPVVLSSQRRSRNSQMQTRTGVHAVKGSAGWHFGSLQGMGIWKAGIGVDILSNATDYTLTLSIAIAAGDAQATFTSLPALPTGVGSWEGAILSVDTGGTTEYKPVLGVAGAVIKTTPFVAAHTTGAAVKIKIQHIFQEQVGTSLMALDLLSFCAQYGRVNESQVTDAFVETIGFKGANETVDVSSTYVINQPINEVGALATTLTPATNEANDSPWIMRDGGLLTPFQPSDVVPQAHNRLTAIDYMLTNKFITEKFGGGNYTVQQNILDDRSQTVTWSETAGQNGPTPTIYTNYVNTQAELPAFFFFNNLKNPGICMSLFFPRCVVLKYKKRQSMGQTVGYDGSILPLEDPTRGISVRMCVQNLVTASSY